MLSAKQQTRQQQKQALAPNMIKSFQLYDMPIQTLSNFICQMTSDNLFLQFDHSIMEEAQGLFAADGSEEWAREGSSRCDPAQLMVSPDPCDSLRNELRLQIFLMPALPPDVRYAALQVVKSLDSKGYFPDSIQQLASQIGIPVHIAEDGLALVQTLSPPGIGARSLKECLLLQSRSSPDYPLIEMILQNDSNAAETRNYTTLSQLCHVSKAKIEQVFSYLSTLRPYPCSMDDEKSDPHYIYPDIFVQRNSGHLEVGLSHGDDLLRLDTGYYQQLKQASVNDKRSLSFVRQQYNEAREWLHILKIRQSTLQQFAYCLVQLQRDFFLNGPGYMQPLNMRYLSEQMGMHPSTICRLAKDKYISTDWGTLPVHALFSSAFYTENGMVSADTVKNQLSALIKAEDPAHPASDQNLAAMLSQQLDILVSRRTIAKYRAELGIGCMHKRKRAAYHSSDGEPE